MKYKGIKMDDKKENQYRIFLKYVEISLLKVDYTEDEIEYLRKDYLRIDNVESLSEILDHYTHDKHYFDSIIKGYRRENRLKQLLDK